MGSVNDAVRVRVTVRFATSVWVTVVGLTVRVNPRAVTSRPRVACAVRFPPAASKVRT